MISDMKDSDKVKQALALGSEKITALWLKVKELEEISKSHPIEGISCGISEKAQLMVSSILDANPALKTVVTKKC